MIRFWDFINHKKESKDKNLKFRKCSVVVTLRCYDNCILLVSTLLSLTKYAKNSLDIKVTFCGISWKSDNRKDNFEGSPRTFGTDLVIDDTIFYRVNS